MDLWAAVIGGVVGAGTGILTTSWKTRKDLESQYDIDVRAKRVESYQSLLCLLEPLAFYTPPEPVLYLTIEKVSGSMRHWYYETGGLFMSVDTRNSYFAVQERLTGLVENVKGSKEQQVGYDDRERMKAGAS